VNNSTAASDLIVVTADIDAAGAIRALLDRYHALSIRKITATVDRYVGRDSGCYHRAHEYLRPFIGQFHYALVVFDRHGCGNESQSRVALEDDVEERLHRNGWADRCAAIVLDPELEAWVWSDSPHVSVALGWPQDSRQLRSWLVDRGWLQQHQTKPKRPKEAMEAVLHWVRKPRSSAIYEELARKVSLRRCSDAAFAKLRTTLQRWFPIE